MLLPRAHDTTAGNTPRSPVDLPYLKDFVLPKKVHGRSAPKSRSRARNAARPLPVSAQAAATQDEFIPSGPPQRTVTQAQGSAATRPVAARRPNSARRTPVLAINYDYLRRDIKALSILAPSMVVLLLIAFFVFR